MRLTNPPAKLECNERILEAGAQLHRLHRRDLDGEQFNPGYGETRFAPCVTKTGKIPTMYAATSYDCAVFEYIFHDIDPTEPFKVVHWSDVEQVDYSILALKREVKVAKLFNPDLMNWGITRTQLIDSPASEWPKTRRWSAAIHDAHDWVEGMIWTSKKYDEEQALMLFGDRSSAIFEVVSRVSVSTDPRALTRLYELATESKIDIIR